MQNALEEGSYLKVKTRFMLLLFLSIPRYAITMFKLEFRVFKKKKLF
jgi:hypothetical protein